MIERPNSCPREGVVPAWDAGWNAHEVGLERESVEVLTPLSGLGWALLGYDTRAFLADREHSAACLAANGGGAG